jgi:hypothetical protein
MRAPTVAKAILGLFGAALIFCGVGLVAVALTIALQTRLGMPGGAAVAGIILLLPPLGWALVYRWPAPPAPTVTAESAVVALLSVVARDKPLLAILGAGLFGVAGVLLKRKR